MRGFIKPLLISLLLATGFLTAQTVSTLVADINLAFPEALSRTRDNILFSPSGRQGVIYRIEPDGQFTVFAQNQPFPQGGTVDDAGAFLVSLYNTGMVRRFDRDGSFINIAGGFQGPTGCVINPGGDTLYVANYAGNSVSKVPLAGGTVLPFVAGGGINGPDGLVFDEAGNLYIANFNDNLIHVADPQGNLRLFATLPSPNSGYLTRGGEQFYITGSRGHQIFRIFPQGDVSVLAGTGAPGFRDGRADSAQFSTPNGIAINAAADSLFIVDVGNRAIRIIELTPTAIDKPDDRSGLNFELLPNYPNPFNPETTLSFRLSRSGTVKLAVYDIAGRHIRTVIQDRLGAGLHRFRFSDPHLSSGVYFCQLSARGKVATQKMLVVR